MSSSTNKGNISNLLFTLVCIALAALVTVLARLMVGDGLRTGRYMNPNVATKVVGGTIYDANGRILAMDVPIYNVYANHNCSEVAIQILSLHLDMTPDEITSKLAESKPKDTTQEEASSTQADTLVKSNIDTNSISGLQTAIKEHGLEGFVTIRREYTRRYPAAFHGAQLLQEIEDEYHDQLFPIPEFDVSTTYGNDLHLSLETDKPMDVFGGRWEGYVDKLRAGLSVIGQVYELQNPVYVAAGIVDARTAKMLACTTYPFYDLNDGSDRNGDASFVDSFSTNNAMFENISIVDSVTDHRTGERLQDVSIGSRLNGNTALEGMISNANGSTAIAALIPEDAPLFAVYICPMEPKYYTNSTVLEDAVAAIEEGLQSQGRLGNQSL